MPVDNDRFQSLIRRAAFNAELWRGTVQDLSPAQRAMAFVGAPTWSRINGWPILKQNAVGDGATSGNVANIVDVTTPFWLECIFVSTAGGTACYALQQGLSTFGGFVWYWSVGAGNKLVLEMYDGAAGAARSIAGAGGSHMPGILRHTILAVTPLSGSCWVNGIPSAMTIVNTRAATNCAPRAVRVMGTLGGCCQTMLARAWQGTPTNEDVACLAEQAKLMVGGW